MGGERGQGSIQEPRKRYTKVGIYALNDEDRAAGAWKFLTLHADGGLMVGGCLLQAECIGRGASKVVYKAFDEVSCNSSRPYTARCHTSAAALWTRLQGVRLLRMRHASALITTCADLSFRKFATAADASGHLCSVSHASLPCACQVEGIEVAWNEVLCSDACLGR